MVKSKVDVWNKPKLVEMLKQPLGSPVELSEEEAIEIIHMAAGRRRDLPPGEEFVREVRPSIGHSIVERAKGQDE